LALLSEEVKLKIKNFTLPRQEGNNKAGEEYSAKKKTPKSGSLITKSKKRKMRDNSLVPFASSELGLRGGKGRKREREVKS